MSGAALTQRRAGGGGKRLAAILSAVALLAAAGGCAPGAAVTADQPLTVAAAADLMPAFELLGTRFEEHTGERVTFSFGSSGQLAQQIIEGAPFDLYASANVAFVDEVVAAGRGDAATQATYAFGRIAIWADGEAWRGWQDLAGLTADETVETLAIANPDHAPYGLAAQQALESAGVWEEVRPRLVYGENIADTQRLAATGNADAAILALSLALASDEAGEGQWTLLPAGLHAPLQQDLVVVTDDANRAELAAAFIEYVNSEDGREIMRRFGFLLPGEEPPASWEED